MKMKYSKNMFEKDGVDITQCTRVADDINSWLYVNEDRGTCWNMRVDIDIAGLN